MEFYRGKRGKKNIMENVEFLKAIWDFVTTQQVYKADYK